MTPCKECGRVNPPEATYCMTCAAPLGNASQASSGGQSRWEGFKREERGPESAPTPPPKSEADGVDGRFEKVAPYVEDFVFDMVRAGAKIYFAVKDPNPPVDARSRQDRNFSDRFERLKDAIAEARVEYRRKGPFNGNRSER